MFNTIVKKLFGDKSKRDLQELLPIVERINNEFEKLSAISDDELRDKTADFKKRIKKHNLETTSKIIDDFIQKFLNHFF